MTEAVGGEKIVRADRRTQVVVLVAWLACVAVGTVLMLWIIPAGQAHLEQQDARTALRYVQVLLAVLFLSLVPIAGYMLRFGRRVVQSGQMPPPGTKVIMDTKVIEGDAAATRGRIMTVLATVLLVLALLGGLYLPYRLEQLLGDKVQAPQDAIEPAAPQGSAPGSERRTGPGETLDEDIPRNGRKKMRRRVVFVPAAPALLGRRGPKRSERCGDPGSV
jgi:hypothetical protein